MRLSDTHCHLADAAFEGRVAQILAEAESVGVGRFVVPATRPGDWQRVAEVSSVYAEVAQIRPAFGIHPWFAQDACEQDFARLAAVLAQHPHAWVGEIGLDYYDKTQTPSQRIRQQNVFRRQLETAQELQRRVVIHNLKAGADLAALIRQSGFRQGGIVHAFSGSIEEAGILIRLGFKIGIGSLLLNPNAKKVRQTLAALDDGDFVLETDSPFMLKNALNTPANIRKIAEIAAEIRKTDIETLAGLTERNTDALWEKRA